MVKAVAMKTESGAVDDHAGLPVLHMLAALHTTLLGNVFLPFGSDDTFLFTVHQIQTLHARKASPLAIPGTLPLTPTHTRPISPLFQAEKGRGMAE